MGKHLLHDPGVPLAGESKDLKLLLHSFANPTVPDQKLGALFYSIDHLHVRLNGF